MSTTKIPMTMTALAMAVALTACGGGGGGSSQDEVAISVTSSGTITRFGSVVVNGVRYETENAVIVSADDGAVLGQGDDDVRNTLALGQVVTVRGTRIDDSNGVANRVIFDDELKGQITEVNETEGFIRVLGQIVAITPDTFIDDSIIVAAGGAANVDTRFSAVTQSITELFAVDDFVEISGFPSQNGLEATRIEDINDDVSANPGAFEAEVKGFVRNHAAGMFEINGLTVFYDSNDLDAEDFPGPNPTLADGQFVEVKGTPVAGQPNQLNASEIELEDEDDLFGDDSNEIEIEGVIQQVIPGATAPAGTIVINGLSIPVNDVSNFAPGLRVEVKGVLQADGTVLVTRIKDEAEDTVRIEDLIASVGADSVTTRLGLQVTLNQRTRLENDVIEDDDDLTIAQFLSAASVDNRLEARGFPLNGSLTWTRAEIEDDADLDCSLRGPVESISGDATSFSFSIQGVTIDVAGVEVNGFRGPNELPLSKTDFFNQLDEGDIVEADANSSGCLNLQLQARQVQFEPSDDIFVGDDNGGDDDGIGGDDDGLGNEIVNSVNNITTDSFDIAGLTVTVAGSTLIDDSIIEAARGVETELDDTFANLSSEFTLAQLLNDGQTYEVKVDASLVVLSIEDVD